MHACANEAGLVQCTVQTIVSIIFGLMSKNTSVSTNIRRHGRSTSEQRARRREGAVACGGSRAPARRREPISTLSLSAQELLDELTIEPSDKRGAKVCARADLPHSIGLAAPRYVVRLAQSLTSRRRVTTTRLPVALWASKPTHKPSKMKPNKL